MRDIIDIARLYFDGYAPKIAGRQLTAEHGLLSLHVTGRVAWHTGESGATRGRVCWPWTARLVFSVTDACWADPPWRSGLTTTCCPQHRVRPGGRLPDLCSSTPPAPCSAAACLSRSNTPSAWHTGSIPPPARPSSLPWPNRGLPRLPCWRRRQPCYPSLPPGKRPRRIHCCRAATWAMLFIPKRITVALPVGGEAFDLSALVSDLEMIHPLVLPWVDQTDNHLGRRLMR
jgi:hypothetical protein